MQSPLADALVRLARAIARHCAHVTMPDGGIGDALRHLQTAAARARPGSPVAGSRRHSELVRRCCDQAGREPTASIASQLLPVRDALPWCYHYPPRCATEDLGERIGFAELIGPDGPLQAPACRVGFTLVAPDTAYPLHAHPAVELYLVIAGRARWRAGDTEQWMSPGALVLHRAHEPHAMRTFDEPLLALWGWSGEIDAPAAYIQ